MKIGIELLNPKQVMEAFLAGEKLSNEKYFNGWGNDITKEPDHYLYLSDTGQICEEDGAGAKSDRVPITMRNGEKWWIVVD